jgi:hypothetical protein
MPTGSNADWTNARRPVASYATYADAEKAVDYLADNTFPVEHVAVVARNLQMVEQVTGRLTWGTAALRGAATGAVVGMLIGWLFAVLDWFDPVVSRFWLIIDGLWFGMLVGIFMGLIMYAFQRGRRDFDAVPTMTAETYDVVVDDPYADDARRMLSGLRLPSRIDDAGPAPVAPPASPSPSPVGSSGI